MNTTSSAAEPHRQPIEMTKPIALDPYEQLKEAIYLGDLLPGQHLVETTLAQSLGVSRTPVREALTRLEQDRLLVRTRLGLTVRERSPGEVLDIYAVRVLLESAASHTAAERRTEHDVLELRQAQRRYVAVGEKEPIDRVRANRYFHQVVWRAAHHRALRDLLERIELQLGRFPITTLSYPGRWESSVAQHAALVEAIVARDRELAAQIATEHFTAARDIRLTLWENED